MTQQQHPGQPLVELQKKTLKRENEMLTGEISKLREREMYHELKQSLDEAVKNSAQQLTELELQPVNSEAAADTVDISAINELQEKLRQTD